PSELQKASFDDHERLAELDRLAVLDQDLDDGAGARRRDLIHGLHRLDDEQRLARTHTGAPPHKKTPTPPRRPLTGPRQGPRHGPWARSRRQDAWMDRPDRCPTAAVLARPCWPAPRAPPRRPPARDGPRARAGRRARTRFRSGQSRRAAWREHGSAHDRSLASP